MAPIYRVRATWSGYTGGPGLSTFYFQGSAPTTAPEALEAANRVRAFFASAAAQIPNTVVVNVSGQVDVIDYTDGQLITSYGVTAPAAVVGSNASGLQAIATAALIRMGTNAVVNGRRLAGRSFFSPLGLDRVGAGGNLVVACTTALVTACGFLTTVVSVAITPVVWHRPPKNTTTGTVAPVTTFTVPAKPAVLRSRRD